MSEIINYTKDDFIGYELSYVEDDQAYFYCLVNNQVSWVNQFNENCLLKENDQGILVIEHLQPNITYLLRPKLSIDDFEIDDYWLIEVDASNHVNWSYTDSNPLTNNPYFSSMNTRSEIYLAKEVEVPILDSSDDRGGVIACDNCGSSDISLNIDTQDLECNFCRHTVENQPYQKTVANIQHLHGHVVGAGASDIIASADDVITYKCPNCGAEVVLDTNKETLARCHWCRTNFGINDVIPNGAVPDMVLPFSINKEQAFDLMTKFFTQRRRFAHLDYIDQFSINNVIGVYLPYMVIDANYHVNYTGEAEIMTATWVETRWVGSGKDRKRIDTRYYSADRYAFNREFDIIASNLTIEANSSKINQSDASRTNNIVNSIMPFNMDKAMKWSPLYMNGFSAQKRDLNTGDLSQLINQQLLDISRIATSSSIAQSNRQFDRGYKVYNEQLSIKGKQWKAAYCPVWLYSYRGKDKMIHYMAVNGQTKETMGSIPINTKKVTIVAILTLLITWMIVFALFLMSNENLGVESLFNGRFSQLLSLNSDEYQMYIWAPMIIALIIMIAFILYIYSSYRNKSARHYHERETHKNVLNMSGNHRFIRRIRRTTSPRMLW